MKYNTFMALSIAALLFLTACTAPTTKIQEKPAINTAENNLAAVKSNSIDLIKDGSTYKLSADIIKNEINGKIYDMYGYNGKIPGPVIRVEKDSEITVEFTNNLAMDTTVHWHGLRHDIGDDGVPDVSQMPVKPGEYYTYDLYFPDAGVFWYHPHIREDIQQDLGLAGNMLVEPNTKNYYSPVNREELLILDDILIDNKGIVPYGKEHANYVLMGRFGNVMLINGDEDYNLEVNKGEVTRLYLTNVANTRTFNFHIEGAKIKLVGAELSKYEKEEFVDSVIIAPAERYIIEVYFENSGVYEIKNINPLKEYTLGKIVVNDIPVKNSYSSEFSALRINSDVMKDIASFEPYFDKKPDYEISLTLDLDMPMHMNDLMNEEMGNMGMMGDDDTMGSDNMMNDEDSMMDDSNEMMQDEEHEETIEWEDAMPMMNAMLDSSYLTWILEDSTSKKQNMDMTMGAKVGDVIKIRLFNDPDSAHPMQHPIHLHGQRFLVTHIDGEPVENKAWLDTTLVPVGATVDILVDVTNPGEWMMHCHIAEHLEAGMMTSLTVV